MIVFTKYTKVIIFRFQKNKPVGKGDIDLKNRKLDCLVMNHLQKTSPFDAFIAPFWEGKAIYDGAMLGQHQRLWNRLIF